MSDINTKPSTPEELALSADAHEEVIRYLHLSPRVGQRALAELIVAEGNSAELAAQITAKPELRIPSI